MTHLWIAPTILFLLLAWQYRKQGRRLREDRSRALTRMRERDSAHQEERKELWELFQNQLAKEREQADERQLKAVEVVKEEVATVHRHWQEERRELLEDARAERQLLMNRIQAPEKAVAQAQSYEASDGPLHLPADDTAYADEVYEEFMTDGSG